jgi:hypothetical protein
MNKLSEIEEFLRPKKLAIAGASRNPKKFGRIVFTELKNRGFELYPVHPKADEIEGVHCFSSFDQLPEGIENLYIVTPKDQTAGVVSDALLYGIRKIWIQQNSDTREALDLAAQKNVPVISGRCMLMFAEPVGTIHGFHRWLTKVVGMYPKN